MAYLRHLIIFILWKDLIFNKQNYVALISHLLCGANTPLILHCSCRMFNIKIPTKNFNFRAATKLKMKIFQNEYCIIIFGQFKKFLIKNRHNNTECIYSNTMLLFPKFNKTSDDFSIATRFHHSLYNSVMPNILVTHKF